MKRRDLVAELERGGSTLLRHGANPDTSHSNQPSHGSQRTLSCDTEAAGGHQVLDAFVAKTRWIGRRGQIGSVNSPR